jgi:hypothetical protein
VKSCPYCGLHTAYLDLAPHHFCMKYMHLALMLRFEVSRLSFLAFVSQVPVHFVSPFKFAEGAGACHVSFERALDAMLM